MIITRQVVATKLSDHLHNRLSLEDLVDWAENAIMDADFDARDFADLRDIVGRIGLADVRTFGLSWEDCQRFLSRLGYQTQITVLEIA